jgi:superfamily I DNA/RNA helicase
MPSKYARQDWQMEQERNLMYVAYTRALEELYFITLDNLRVVRED